MSSALLLGLVGLAACGGDSGPSTESRAPAPTEPAISAPEAPSPAGKAAPRWETVVTLTGSGGQQPAPFTILPDAIQWRARWTCEGGAIRVTTDPTPRRPAPLVDSPCPGNGEGFSITSGETRLTVEATGPWKLIVDQQLDTPLQEPPPPGLASGEVLGQGDFYRVEKDGGGVARLYRLADGSHILRFENFDVSTNTDLFVWLTESRKPATTVEIVASQHWVLGNLKSTVGDQNYVVPPSVPLERVKSVVIWCDPVAVAYTAAGLS